MDEYIEREDAYKELDRYKGYIGFDEDMVKRIKIGLSKLPAADVRPVVVCADCEHNNHCLTQEFVDDCGKIPLDRNTFFCADGERRSNA